MRKAIFASATARPPHPACDARFALVCTRDRDDYCFAGTLHIHAETSIREARLQDSNKLALTAYRVRGTRMKSDVIYPASLLALRLADELTPGQLSDWLRRSEHPNRLPVLHVHLRRAHNSPALVSVLRFGEYDIDALQENIELMEGAAA